MNRLLCKCRKWRLYSMVIKYLYGFMVEKRNLSIITILSFAHDWFNILCIVPKIIAYEIVMFIVFKTKIETKR